MPWNPNFPMQATSISQSTPQIQTNWNYIATTVGVDHFFNSATPGNDGHHKWVNMLDAGNAPLAAGFDGVVYVKTSGSKVQPFYRNATTIMPIPKAYNFVFTMLASQVNIVLDVQNAIAGMGTFGPFNGIFTIVKQGTTGASGTASVFYDGAGSISVRELNRDGTVSSVSGANGPSQILVTVGGSGAGNWNASLLVMEF